MSSLVRVDIWVITNKNNDKITQDILFFTFSCIIMPSFKCCPNRINFEFAFKYIYMCTH
jgi:hypothetical protein